MPKFEITGPDGRRYEVDAPNAEAVQQAAAQMFGGAQAAAAPAPSEAAGGGSGIVEGAKNAVGGVVDAVTRETAPPDAVDYLSDVNASTWRGARRGVANALGFPVDIANAVLLGAGGDAPVGGAESFDRLLGGFGALPEPERKSGVARVAGRIGEEVGSIALPAGAVLAKAGQVGVQGARKLGDLSRYFVEQAAINPSAFLGKELAGATTAGTAAGLVNEANPTKEGFGHELGDLLGAVFGYGAVGAGKAVGKKITDTGKALFGKTDYVDDFVRDAVTDQILDAAGNRPMKPGGPVDAQPLVDAIEGGRRVNDVIPGFRESVADRTQNPGIAALEYSRQSGPNAGEFTQRRAENTVAVDSAVDRLAPQGNAGALRSELEAVRDARLGDSAARVNAAQADFDKTIEGLTSNMTGEARGADIRSALEDAHAQVKAAVDKLYAPINESAAKVNVGPLVDAFGAIDRNLSVAEVGRFRPSEAAIPASFIDPDNAATAMQPLREVTGIRSALTDRAREAGTAGRTNEARIINDYIASLDSYVEGALPDGLKSQWDAARAGRKDLADRFERPQTAIAQTLDKREGLYAQPDSAVARKFLQPDEGRLGDFEALIREAGGDARVQGALRDQIVADVRDRGLLEKPDALERYVQQHSKVFERLPDLRDSLGGAAGAKRVAAGAEANYSDLMREIGPQGKSTVARYLQYGDENADRAMRAVMAAKDPTKAADELLGFVGDKPEAVEGARKVFWDIMQKSSRRAGETTMEVGGAQPWMPRAFKGFLDDPRNAAVAERLYRDNPEHLTNLKQIAEALQGVDVRNSAKAPNTSGTAQGVNNVLTPETLQSRLYAWRRGQIGPTFLLTSLAAVSGRRAVNAARAGAIDRMLDEALLNPDAAALLLKENNPANRAAMARGAKLWLGNEASTFMSLITPKREDDDLNEAATR